MTMTDTTAVAVVQTTITGGKMRPLTGTLTEIPGTDAVSQRVCVLHSVHAQFYCLVALCWCEYRTT